MYLLQFVNEEILSLMKIYNSGYDTIINKRCYWVKKTEKCQLVIDDDSKNSIQYLTEMDK